MPTIRPRGRRLSENLQGQRHPAHRRSVAAARFKGKPLKRGNRFFVEHENNAFVRDGKWKLVGAGYPLLQRGRAFTLGALRHRE